VLFLELLQSSGVRHTHAAELRLPGVERRLRYAMPAAQLRHLHPGFLLTQDPDDLLLTDPASLHPSVPLRGCGLYLYLEEFSGLRSRHLLVDETRLMIAAIDAATHSIDPIRSERVLGL